MCDIDTSIGESTHPVEAPKNDMGGDLLHRWSLEALEGIDTNDMDSDDGMLLLLMMMMRGACRAALVTNKCGRAAQRPPPPPITPAPAPGGPAGPSIGACGGTGGMKPLLAGRVGGEGEGPPFLPAHAVRPRAHTQGFGGSWPPRPHHPTSVDAYMCAGPTTYLGGRTRGVGAPPAGSNKSVF